jgi:hypothetical protein
MTSSPSGLSGQVGRTPNGTFAMESAVYDARQARSGALSVLRRGFLSRRERSGEEMRDALLTSMSPELLHTVFLSRRERNTFQKSE